MSDDDDAGTQANILAALEKYGDSVLGDEPKRKKSQKKRCLNDDPKESQSVKRKRKKNKGKEKQISIENDKDFDDDQSEDEDQDGEKALSSEQRHIADLKRKLGLTSADFMTNKISETDKSQTKQKSRGKGTGRPEPEIIVFKDPAKRRENRTDDSSSTLKNIIRGDTDDDDDDSDIESDGHSRSKPSRRSESYMHMRDAKFDVMMLGIKGLDKVDREKARLDMAIKLGAKPPKRPYQNYKQLQQEKLKQKTEAQTKRLESRDVALISKSNSRKRRQRDKNDIGFVDGQVGSYKSGVQVLNKYDIQKIKSSRQPSRGGRYGGRSSRGGRSRGGRS